MRPTKRALLKAIDKVLVAEGFRRAGTTWHCDGEETILVLNLQGSMWGRNSYINLAVWLKALGQAKNPKEYICHIRTRLGGAKLERALDEEDASLSEEERVRAISSAVKTRGLKFLKGCATVAGIRKMQRSGKLNNALVNWRVGKLLNKMNRTSAPRKQRV